MIINLTKLEVHTAVAYFAREKAYQHLPLNCEALPCIVIINADHTAEVKLISPVSTAIVPANPLPGVSK